MATQEESWAERIEWIVKTLCDGNRTVLAKKVGVSTEAISGIILRGSVPGGDKLEKIIEVFPKINPDWLLTGKGPRTRDYQPPATPTKAQVVLERIQSLMDEVGAAGDPVIPNTADVGEGGTLAKADAEARRIEESRSVGRLPPATPDRKGSARHGRPPRRDRN